MPHDAKAKGNSKKRKKRDIGLEHISEELLLRLKKHNLQQYKHTFEDMGYCENLQALLNHKNYEQLVSEINFLPGHKKRFEDMM